MGETGEENQTEFRQLIREGMG